MSIDNSLTFSRLLVTLGCAFFTAIFIQMLRPADLSRAEGFDEGGVESRNLTPILKRAGAATATGEVIELSEREVNAWVAKTLRGRQRGWSSVLVSFEGACVNFTPGEVEVILVRRFMGRQLATSCVLAISADSESFSLRSAGSSVGQLRIRPWVLEATLESFRRLTAVYSAELTNFRSAGNIALEEGRVVLSSR